MTYTPNTPQASDQIAATQPLIQANFTFLDNAIGQEHNFNTSDATQTYHLQASMPNLSDPSSLPSGTNGLYYINAGVPKFYNTAANFIALSNVSPVQFFSGKIVFSTTGPIPITPTITGNVSGSITIWNNTSTANWAVRNFIQLSTNGGAVNQIVPVVGSGGLPTNDVKWSSTSSGATLNITNTAGTPTIHYTGWYVQTV